MPLLRQSDVVIKGDVLQIRGCHTQARSLDAVAERTCGAITLGLEAEGAPREELEFVGIERVTVAA